MSDTIRIRTTPNGGDKYIKVKLEQEFDFIEILSLNISQEDAYRKFCSDYGVIVGRVSVNSGFGIPNAKVSVFIPLDSIDQNDPLISGLYPYEVVTDKDYNGVRYNLLPNNSDTQNECFTPVGTFPTKREILDNDTLLGIYNKYYKFTTTTNHAGDFMIFGVPIGSYTIHVDADISDIGIASQRPYDLISKGTPPNLFNSPTKFSTNKNLDSLVQVKTLNVGVNVQPFWGDTENCTIGINRLDLDLNYNITPSAIFVGSIYGDQDKHSVNKHCHPRVKLGEICDQVTGPGSVEMLRETIDGGVEIFNVQGGRVIDDDGTWAYQIPMNLDYMVTDENGNLILSHDPSKGIPTRASVRFRIGMDELGDEGRLRTRAKYLVPNNPQTHSEVDYNFDATTLKTSFKDLYWNKIYTVSNFISRFQRNDPLRNISTRNTLAVKNVDACAGTKTPFPYNRIGTVTNPIFIILCLLITIVGDMIYIINKLILPAINFLIKIINDVLGAIVSVIDSIVNAINSVASIFGGSIGSGPSWTNINYIGCTTVQCPSDSGFYYAPGCTQSSLGFGAGGANTPTYFPGDSFCHKDSPFDLCGLNDCTAYELAVALGLYNLDFYNDWINGTLYGFLLKYKHKQNGSEKFCEYDCDGAWPTEGTGNNNCYTNLLLDTCYFNIGDPDSQKNAYDSGPIQDGLIKKVGDNLYYAATTHDLLLKLFATDIVTLGSVFECDWQGIPFMQPFLIPTTYKIPPPTQELSDSNKVEVSGIIENGQNCGGANCGELFNIDCLGIHVSYAQCENIRHLCEFGVDISKAIEDVYGNITSQADCSVGSVNEIENNGGKFFRDGFLASNTGTTTPYTVSLPSNGLDSGFNNPNIFNGYDFSSILPTLNINGVLVPVNGIDYFKFRGLTNQSSYQSPTRSFFFYFGLNPGKTAIDKMNARFFTNCTPVIQDSVIIQTNTTQSVTPNTGTLSFSFIGGSGTIAYTVTGIAPTSYGPVTGSIGYGIVKTLSSLSVGLYLIRAIDALENLFTTTVEIFGATPLYAGAGISQNCSTSISNDGKITITSVGGGIGGYQYKLQNSTSTTIVPYTPFTIPTTISNLPEDTYTLTVRDTTLTTYPITGLTVSGPSTILVINTTQNVTCFGGNNGSISLAVTGGEQPYTLTTTGSGGPYNGNSITGLIAGTYTTTVTDSLSVSQIKTTVITQPIQLIILNPIVAKLNKQCDPNNYIIPFYISSSSISPGSVSVEYSIDGGVWLTNTMNYTNQTTPLTITIHGVNTITNNIRIRFSSIQGGNTCYSNVLSIPLSQITLPPSNLVLTQGALINECTPLVAKVNLNISYLTRAPYTINYNIVGGGSGSIVTSINPTTLSIPVTSAHPIINFSVSDNLGCVSPILPISFTVPTQVLAATAITPIYNSFNGDYTHKFTPTGGIAPYSCTSCTTGNGPFTFINTQPTMTLVIKDASGCSISIIG